MSDPVSGGREGVAERADPATGGPAGARLASEALLRAVADQSTDIIVVMTEREVLFANGRAEEVLGTTVVGREPRSLMQFVHPDDLDLALARFAEVFARVGRHDTSELRLRSQGDWRVFEFLATNLGDEPAVGGVLFTARDVTERHRTHRLLLEQQRRTHALELRRHEERVAAQLQRAAQLDTVGRLAAGAAHDFGNLLGVVANCSAHVAQLLPDDHPAREDLALVDDAVSRATDLVRQLLLFGSPPASRRSQVDARELAADVVAMLTAPSGVEIGVETCAGPLPVTVDRARIDRALLNVLVNALDAVGDHGRVTVRTDRIHVTARPATALGVQPGGYARITVRDDGPGMPAEVLERAFEPFFTVLPERDGTQSRGRDARGEARRTAATGGTGLGLPTARDAVERAGGALSLRSAPGRGTTATILLPLAAASVPD
jgi:PAS domain S-box-containing protein